jgi:RNA recognition motif-containing protein
MSTKLYVGNLSFSTTEASLGDFFAQIGSVASVKLITDRDTGRSRGFGFVEMSSPDEAEKAISELNGKELDGRAISVSEARPQAPRTGGGGGFGGGGGRGGGGGGFGGGGRGGGGGGFGGGGGRGGRGGGGGGRGGRGGDDRY